MSVLQADSNCEGRIRRQMCSRGLHLLSSKTCVASNYGSSSGTAEKPLQRTEIQGCRKRNLLPSSHDVPCFQRDEHVCCSSHNAGHIRHIQALGFRPQLFSRSGSPKADCPVIAQVALVFQSWQCAFTFRFLNFTGKVDLSQAFGAGRRRSASRRPTCQEVQLREPCNNQACP